MFHVAEGTRHSGGGSSVRRNLLELAGLRPDLLTFADSSQSDSLLVTLNRVPASSIRSGRYIYMPQNATGWSPVMAADARELQRRIALKAVSRVSFRRAAGVIRIGSAIPAPRDKPSFLIPNVLDEGFEECLAEPICEPLPKSLADTWVIISGDQAYKNLALVKTAAMTSQERILVRGPLGSRTVREMSDVKDLVLDPRNANRSLVAHLLANAKGVIFPSLVEASPITVLEARALGKRILCADIAAHRDLCDGLSPGVQFFDPRSHDDLTMKLSNFSSTLPGNGKLRTPAGRASARSSWLAEISGALESCAALMPNG